MADTVVDAFGHAGTQRPEDVAGRPDPRDGDVRIRSADAEEDGGAVESTLAVATRMVDVPASIVGPSSEPLRTTTGEGPGFRAACSAAMQAPCENPSRTTRSRSRPSRSTASPTTASTTASADPTCGSFRSRGASAA